LLHEGLLEGHVYICGPTGASKTSLGITPLCIQQIRGSKTDSEEQRAPNPLFVLDMKGDAACFHTIRMEAERRGHEFLFFTLEKNCPTYRFHPFRGFDRASRTVAQLCQLILDALSLNHGSGYGRMYYTERSRNLLSLTMKRHPNISSFEELYAALRSTL